jgi:hypothetical protein
MVCSNGKVNPTVSPQSLQRLGTAAGSQGPILRGNTTNKGHVREVRRGQPKTCGRSGRKRQHERHSKEFERTAPETVKNRRGGLVRSVAFRPFWRLGRPCVPSFRTVSGKAGWLRGFRSCLGTGARVLFLVLAWFRWLSSPRKLALCHVILWQ